MFRIIIGFGKHDFALRQKAVSQRASAALQPQYVHRHDVRAVQRNQTVHGADKGVRAAAPAHHFRDGQFFNCLIDDVFQQFGKRFARLDKLVRVHILFAVVDDFQAAYFHTAGACKAFQRFGRNTVFHARSHGNAFFDYMLVCLNGFYVVHRHCQTARRSVGGILHLSVDQLRFFQPFGNGGGKMVAECV